MRSAMSRRRLRQWVGSRWLTETRRSGLAFVVGVPVVIYRGATVESGSGRIAASAFDTALLFLAAYLMAYVAVTIVAFTLADDEQVRHWARREGRGSWAQRYLWGTAPGPGVSIWLGALALGVAVFWLPQSDSGGSQLPDWARPAVGIGIVASAWLAVALSYAVAYWADDLLEHEAGLEFPGESVPGWSDYVYFAVAVSTTFGPTDVTVQSRAMRRTVTVHALLAFVFNTVIVAAVVGSLATL